MSSVVLVRQPSSGLVARSSAGNGIAVRDLHFQRRSVHKCSAGGSATFLAATPTKCRQQHGEGRQVGRGTESSGRRRFDGSARFAKQLCRRPAARHRNAKPSSNVPRDGWQGWKRNRRKSKSSWTPLRDEWPGFWKRWPGQCHQPHRPCPRPHSPERSQISWQSSVV